MRITRHRAGQACGVTHARSAPTESRSQTRTGDGKLLTCTSSSLTMTKPSETH